MQVADDRLTPNDRLFLDELKKEHKSRKYEYMRKWWEKLKV
jgi:hypothetical protein